MRSDRLTRNACISLICILSLVLPIKARAQSIVWNEEIQTENEESTTISLLHKYDSADTAVVRSVDTKNSTITLCQHELGRYYTLNVDNTSMIYDRFEMPISLAMLTPGTVVDATFLHQSKHLNSLVVSQTAWTREGVSDYSIDAEKMILRMGGQNYRLPSTVLILGSEEGSTRRIIAEEILEGDLLTVRGIDKEIYGITVTSGHGYLRLTSTQVGERSLSGAWINLDNKVISRINEKTLVSAPEGSYTLRIMGQGANDERPVEIQRGRETLIDSSTIKMEEIPVTEVTFTVLPEEAEATLTVEGDKVKTGTPIPLTQGVHPIKVEAEGYVSMSKQLKVGTKPAAVELTMEKDEENEDSSSGSTGSTGSSAVDGQTQGSAANTGVSDWWFSGTAHSDTGFMGDLGTGDETMGQQGESASVVATTGSSGSTASTAASGSTQTVRSITVIDASGNEITRTTVPGREIRVESPVGVEFYMDGDYMGITPTSFPKIGGQHTVTLSREGYETRSFNIYIDSEQTDKTYAFPELTKEEE